MGNKQGYIDAGKIGQPANNQSQPQIDPNFENFIKNAFQQAAVNGKLYKDKFNEVLAVLENLQIKRLRNTPLGERLFHIFDIDNSNTISEQELMKGLTSLLQDKETRIQYSFKVIDKDNDNKLSRREFVEFFEESWIVAFRLLGEKVSKSQTKYNVNLAKINNWATNHLDKLRENVGLIYTKMDSMNKGFVDYMVFKNWIQTCEIHSIIANFDFISVEVPVNLYQLEAKQSAYPGLQQQ